jgi:hypothetical protein
VSSFLQLADEEPLSLALMILCLIILDPSFKAQKPAKSCGPQSPLAQIYPQQLATLPLHAETPSRFNLKKLLSFYKR